MSLLHYVTRIHFAERVLEDALPEEVRARCIRAPLIVTDADADAGLTRVLDCLAESCTPQVLDLGGIDGVGAMVDAVRKALDGDDAEAGTCDAVIGLGGMLALDLTRIAAVRAVRDGARGGAAGRTLPVFAVPTLPVCLGLTPQPSLLRGRASATKSCKVPDVLICDPGLLQSASPARLAVSGMDALIHCLEALLSSAWNPPADGMAFDGLRRAGLWLERLVADPGDARARREVLAAALNGALAAQKGFGAIHALSHALETVAPDDLPHGGLHAALAGPVLAFNAPAVPDAIASAAEALCLSGPGALQGHLTALGARLGLPERLGHLGLTPVGIERVAEAAVEDCATRSNPRHATAADYCHMIRAAL